MMSGRAKIILVIFGVLNLLLTFFYLWAMLLLGLYWLLDLHRL